MQERHKDAHLDHVYKLLVESFIDYFLKTELRVVQNLDLMLLNQKWNGHPVEHLLYFVFRVGTTVRLVVAHTVNATQLKQRLLDLPYMSHVNLKVVLKTIRVFKFHGDVFQERYR